MATLIETENGFVLRDEMTIDQVKYIGKDMYGFWLTKNECIKVLKHVAATYDDRGLTWEKCNEAIGELYGDLCFQTMLERISEEKALEKYQKENSHE